MQDCGQWALKHFLLPKRHQKHFFQIVSPGRSFKDLSLPKLTVRRINKIRFRMK